MISFASKRSESDLQKVSTVTRQRRVSLGNKINPTLPRYGTDLFQQWHLRLSLYSNRTGIAGSFFKLDPYGARANGEIIG